MSFFVYLFVLLVAASSVLFGLDWMQAPLQPTPRTPQSVTFAPATPAQPSATPAPAVANASPAAITPDTPATPLTGASGANMTTGSSPAEEPKTQASEPAPAPLCDVSACERAYRSFTAADCTYQPSSGERRLCKKGNPPRGASAQPAEKEANAQAHCNVSACESAYQSFDAATCTYQSYAGARRLCTK